jgi:hypothetical protein
MVEPNACRHCSVGEREHYQRWTKTAGWHEWTEPADQQRKEQMLARRAATQITDTEEDRA